MARGTQSPSHSSRYRLVVAGELTVGGEQFEHGDRVAQVPLGEVVLRRTDDRGRDEVAVSWRGVLDQVAAEQFADQRLEHHVGGEDGLAPVVDPGELLGHLAHALPGRVGVPCLQVRRPVEAVDLLGQRQVVQGQVLRRADPVHAVHRDRVVVHVRRRPAVGVRVQVEPEPVVHVHPRAHVALDEVDPVPAPLLERLALPRVVDVLVDLPYDVGVVPVEGELPLLVRVPELVPAVCGPVVAPAARARVALGLGPVRAPCLEHGPVQRVTAAAIGEPVQPALREVVPRVRLDLHGHVLVLRLLALGRGVVVELAGGGVGKLLGTGFCVGEDRLGNTALRSGCHEVLSFSAIREAVALPAVGGSGAGLTPPRDRRSW